LQQQLVQLGAKLLGTLFQQRVGQLLVVLIQTSKRVEQLLLLLEDAHDEALGHVVQDQLVVAVVEAHQLGPVDQAVLLDFELDEYRGIVRLHVTCICDEFVA
jgi:hypothetical protein